MTTNLFQPLMPTDKDKLAKKRAKYILMYLAEAGYIKPERAIAHDTISLMIDLVSNDLEKWTGNKQD